MHETNHETRHAYDLKEMAIDQEKAPRNERRPKKTKKEKNDRKQLWIQLTTKQQNKSRKKEEQYANHIKNEITQQFFYEKQFTKMFLEE